MQARDLPPEFQRLTEMLVADVDRLCRLTENLLEISRLDSGQEPPEVEPVDAAALVKGVLRSHCCSDTVDLDAHACRSHDRPAAIGANRREPGRERRHPCRRGHARARRPRA